jgi:hypothetical protein
VIDEINSSASRNAPPLCPAMGPVARGVCQSCQSCPRIPRRVENYQDSGSPPCLLGGSPGKLWPRGSLARRRRMSLCSTPERSHRPPALAALGPSCQPAATIAPSSHSLHTLTSSASHHHHDAVGRWSASVWRSPDLASAIPTAAAISPLGTLHAASPSPLVVWTYPANESKFSAPGSCTPESMVEGSI